MGDRHAPVDDAWREEGPRERAEARRPEYETRQDMGRTRAPRHQAGMMLFDALHAFCTDHQYCGEPNGGVEGDCVWMTCTCGAVINRDADDA